MSVRTFYGVAHGDPAVACSREGSVWLRSLREERRTMNILLGENLRHHTLARVWSGILYLKLSFRHNEYQGQTVRITKT